MRRFMMVLFGLIAFFFSGCDGYVDRLDFSTYDEIEFYAMEDGATIARFYPRATADADGDVVIGTMTSQSVSFWFEPSSVYDGSTVLIFDVGFCTISDDGSHCMLDGELIPTVVLLKRF